MTGIMFKEGLPEHKNKEIIKIWLYNHEKPSNKRHRRHRELLFNGHTVSVWEDENIPMHGGDSRKNNVSVFNANEIVLQNS